jgi:hypothetical protein
MFLLTDVLLIPEATENLISVRHATKQGLDFKFSSDRCEIFRKGLKVATARCTDDAIYYLTGQSLIVSPGQGTAMVSRPKESPQLWHERYGHLGYENLAKLTSMVEGIHVSSEKFQAAGAEGLFEPCVLGKQPRSPFKPSTSVATRPLALVHTDVCGPMPVMSMGGNNYFVTLLDDYSRFSAVVPIARKSDAAAAVKDYINLLENQSGQRLRRLRCDNGSEYINTNLMSFCRDKARGANTINTVLTSSDRELKIDEIVPKLPRGWAQGTLAKLLSSLCWLACSLLCSALAASHQSGRWWHHPNP